DVERHEHATVARRGPELVVVPWVPLRCHDRAGQTLSAVLRTGQVTRLAGRLVPRSGVGRIAERLPIAEPGIVAGGRELRTARFEVRLRAAVVDRPPDVLLPGVLESEYPELLTCSRSRTEGSIAGDRPAGERVRVRRA